MPEAEILYEDWRERGAQGVARCLYQSQHDFINEQFYPGTLELCCECDDPTGKAGAGDGSLFLENGEGPFCGTCYYERESCTTSST